MRALQMQVRYLVLPFGAMHETANRQTTAPTEVTHGDSRGPYIR